MSKELEYVKDSSSDSNEYDVVSDSDYEESPLSDNIENKLKESESNKDNENNDDSSDSSITKNYDTDILFNQETNTDISDDNEQVGGSIEDNKFDYIVPLCMSGFILSTFFICRK
tara:strand:- start:491 stop:835 length:345 start_codon:yes stop_codon:yes gene_type:complete